jgi:hypothetical protein
MIYSELIHREDYLRLPKIDKSEVKLLWHSDYWDGPTSGMLLYRGKKRWFQVCDESDDPGLRDYYRRFLIVELSDRQLEEEEYWQGLFREKVGTHTDHELQGESQKGRVNPKEMWDGFYEPYQKRVKLDLSQNTVLGWYET